MKMKLAWHLVIGLLTAALFGAVCSPERRLTLCLHVYVPCANYMPWAKEAWMHMLESYFHFERWLSPSQFEETYELPEIKAEEYTPEKLRHLSQDGRLPVVIRGLVREASACHEAGKPEWVRRYGNFTVMSMTLGKGLHYNDSEVKVTGDTNFSEYVAGIQRGETGRYDAGMDTMLSQYPEIYPSLGLDALQFDALQIAGCRSLSLLVNGQGEGLKWHMANHPNLVSVYHGTKVWELINYRFSIFLGPTIPAGIGSWGYLPANHETIDRIYPFLPKALVKLKAGDSLFNPPWSWHRVSNEGDATTKLVVMSACRWSDVRTTIRLSSALELYKSLGWPAWVHPSMPLWVRWVPLFRILQDGLREIMGSIPSFGETGYDTDCFSSKREACAEVIRSHGFKH
ncbi:unnamed protein product [Symbiodinium necroappetens]|uniref:Cupin-like domain-containing protein n=1 Tax=Symbiodinium necroappetens TaxID=1628268 RepID=A0A812T5Y2_9DINO|nr:unnamed protein product [Symbiodinium necroappetens]